MYIVFDIGGTNMRMSAIKDGITLSEPVIVPTPKDFGDAEKFFHELIKKVAGDAKIDGVAGGIAGLLDKTRKMLLSSPHLPAWVGKPLQETLTKLTNAPVFLENDTTMAGLGEATEGAGRGYGAIAYLTVSTGVGGSRIVNRKSDDGHFNFEPGHQIIDRHSLETLEELVSGSAFQKKYGKHPAEVDDPAIWDEAAKNLAIGINNVILHWSPDAVVVGGSMIVKKVGIPLEAIERHLRHVMKAFPIIPKVFKAELADSGGLIGSREFLAGKLAQK